MIDGKPDIIIGGSPCQNFSNINITDGRGLEGDKSGLFYEYLRLLKECNPKYWLLENVKMKGDSKEQLDKYLEVNGALIDSSLVSFQKRSRYYWTNIPNVTPPKDMNISFQDYIDHDEERCEEASPNKTPSRMRFWADGNGNHTIHSCANITNANKVYCLLTKQDRAPNSGCVAYKDWMRYLTRKEMEQAQTLPIGYCDHLSYNQACNVIGDGWTVDVVKHIFSFIPWEELNVEDDKRTT